MNKLSKIVSRILIGLSRFTFGIQIFGIYGAWNVFILSNRRVSGKLRGIITSVKINNSFTFFFRRGIDHGVLTHFYEAGYYIDYNNGPTINRILDAGANIGDETTRFYLLYPSVEIVSVEAEENNFNVLKRNFSNINSVKLIQAAIWHESGKVSLNDALDSECFSISTLEENSNIVSALAVVDIMSQMNWSEIDIFKIDIEGSEFELFSLNYEAWIDRVKCFIIETHDRYRPETTQIIYKAISNLAFNSYLCGENLILIRSDLPWKLRVIQGISK